MKIEERPAPMGRVVFIQGGGNMEGGDGKNYVKWAVEIDCVGIVVMTRGLGDGGYNFHGKGGEIAQEFLWKD